ncbi:PAS domain-containing response regulator [Halohasta litorea]|uniref:PAS domain S-box protein n=1 Tax=Halohasta litorea TaxID=869891 RepID=A0ABD6D6S0_9EURY|nr:PAS domain S-box protein [Halohasta litorea]
MADSIQILHVDDESSFLDLTAEFLSQEDDRFEIITETSPADGLDRLDTQTFDCIVSDYQMPSTTGIEFLETVRESDPSLPFILFTGEGSEAVASDAISAGATDYLQKQTGTEQYRLLANRIINAVESYQTQRELEQYKLLVETVGDPMYILDTDGSIVLANEALAEMLGCDRETAIGMHAGEFLVDGAYQRGSERLAEIRADPDTDWSTHEVTVTTMDGREIPTEINIAPVTAADGSYEASVGVVRDISARKQRERRLEALHTTTRELIDATAFETAVDVAIRAAEDVLEMDVAGLYAPETAAADRLVPVATTTGIEEVFGEVPAIERDEGLVWRVYTTGDPIFAADVREYPDAYNEETPIRSELLVPVGDHGVFVAGATTTDGFDTTDEELAHILVTTLTRVLDDLDRETTAIDTD